MSAWLASQDGDWDSPLPTTTPRAGDSVRFEGDGMSKPKPDKPRKVRMVVLDPIATESIDPETGYRELTIPFTFEGLKPGRIGIVVNELTGD